ncbi:GNAT family N-acetyltransferase [Arthrobacter sp. NPDC090010]|uniref:GNAT family N-acetyltransferase n=1 Tax=Arthrobacter sp. NPDC090010 TaxID=3363942 RepID=UPI00381B6408
MAEAAKARGHEVFFSGDVEIAFGQKIVQDTFGEYSPRPADAVALAELAATLKADVVHLDSYEDQGNVRDILESRGVLLCSVEDKDFGRRPAHIIVDPSPLGEFQPRQLDGAWRMLRGTGFIPIRLSLKDTPPPPDVATGQERGLSLMIIMGGTDARDLTGTMAGLWAACGVPSTCYVVSPRELSVTAGPGQRLVRLEPSAHVAGAFRHMDLVVSAAGTTVWELASLGVPTAALQTVENQRDTYRYMTESAMVLGLGDASTEVPDWSAAQEALRAALRSPEERDALAETAHHVVDGLGAHRIVEVWEDMVENAEKGLRARPAALGDASLLFEWRNDPGVRAVSRQTDELEWDGHVSWVSRTLGNPSRRLMIIEDGGTPVGTVRFDELEPGEWEASITIAPAQRGKGRALEMLTVAEDALVGAVSPRVLIAEMLTDNAASYRLFQKAGYDGGPAEGKAGWYRLSKELG